MKLPNSYGSISKLSGKRRNPYIVRVTVEATEKGVCKKVRKCLGYAPNKKVALDMLANYHGAPYNLDQKDLTFEEVFNAWFKEYRENEKISQSAVRNYRAAFKAVSTIHDRPIRNLKTADLQSALENSGKNYPTLEKVKILMGQLFKYAIKNDICSKNYASYINLSVFSNKNPKALKRKPFTPREIETLWRHSDNDIAKIALIYLYTGVRATELTDLKKKSVDMENRIFHVQKSKTVSGVRIVPIAEKVYPFFEYFMKNPGEYLITIHNRKLGYATFLEKYWKPFMEQLRMRHYIHDTRHTFISLLTMANVKPVTIKKIVGHKGAMSLTERVYTHLDYAELLDAVNRL